MISKLFEKTYPFLSIGAIEAGKFIDHLGTMFNIFILFLQIVIGVLTIIKIYDEIKRKKFKSVEKTEKETEKKYPFISALYKYLIKRKNAS